ncbi:kinase subunit of RNA polymerase II carboxy-terminal domain kinase I [Puccinia graminis f. sp. tritici]|uniref:Kinase subunit of RNA polymerase II carboxy-terminal domain kinase I n=1 Tax=Puccinia graminis f. sp. tritici TaxID=56615 RepID=A0A5B0QTA9_PUCGR|nr:kinase subunit of RNA polymerase II carboxy-terminal domain kinase I [Puccinia graminis f. sp. tritici]
MGPGYYRLTHLRSTTHCPTLVSFGCSSPINLLPSFDRSSPIDLLPSFNRAWPIDLPSPDSATSRCSRNPTNHHQRYRPRSNHNDAETGFSRDGNERRDNRPGDQSARRPTLPIFISPHHPPQDVPAVARDLTTVDLGTGRSVEVWLAAIRVHHLIYAPSHTHQVRARPPIKDFPRLSDFETELVFQDSVAVAIGISRGVPNPATTAQQEGGKAELAE